jgi:dimethylargininase
MSVTAITRDVSSSINDCELSFHARQPIDVPGAIEQHEAYRECLKQLGATIVSLPAEPRLPDAVFVEDTAVVLAEIAVIANMGAPSRRAESAIMAETLGRYRQLDFMKAPATLDGGDVMRIGRTLFVGLSRRTNRPGLEQLGNSVRPFGYYVEPVEMTGCLHLKSACSYVGHNTILANRSWINVEPLRGFEILNVSGDEPNAANALLLNGVVVLPESFPQTQALLEERGFRVRTVDVSELQKAEAGVTCCSVIFDDQTD